MFGIVKLVCVGAASVTQHTTASAAAIQPKLKQANLLAC